MIQMTLEAFTELKKELENRKEVIRKEIADEIAAARELGDLSENHTYTVAMEKKDLNENRIAEIEDIITRVKIVEENKSDSFVGIGEDVEIENVENTKKRVVSLVGPEETLSANPGEGQISTTSPLGKALLNSKIGDIIEVETPGGVAKYKLVRFVR